MSRIAVLADIHGNMPALEAVLVDLRSCNVDEVLIGGDLVGRGPEGSKVVGTVRRSGWRCIRGNHEDYLLDFRSGAVPEAWMYQEEWAASRWMAAELTDGDIAFIDRLPLSCTAESEPGLRLVHGSPRSHNEGIGPWCTEDELSGHLRRIDEPLLVCAHTHRPLHRRLASGIVVNVGAVGLPFNRDPRAQYAIFERDANDEWEVDFRKVEYDREQTLRIYRSSGFSSHGGVTAALLELELRHAAPFLVPFLKWAAARGVPAASDRIAAFLDIYDIDEPMRRFLRRLKQR